MFKTIESTPLLDMPVNEIIRSHPETVAVFKTFGIDACCGGARRLREVIERHALDENAILEALGVAAQS